ncbi:hypothetical protein BDP27DRAFT_1431721 [Rhodocollybia butyracea]|uniref:Uncharacterized protein n=1 Tax=Rhodocollybia butyracea TaxID=206335 RepID=A0A9P5P9R2_9AGAR|nr:hypothetical protein BDP27DRAFT_1431721 [Rhodocollybia butyracea]
MDHRVCAGGLTSGQTFEQQWTSAGVPLSHYRHPSYYGQNLMCQPQTSASTDAPEQSTVWQESWVACDTENAETTENSKAHEISDNLLKEFHKIYRGPGTKAEKRELNQKYRNLVRIQNILADPFTDSYNQACDRCYHKGIECTSDEFTLLCKQCTYSTGCTKRDFLKRMRVQERMNINDSEYAALYNASGFGPQKSLHAEEQRVSRRLKKLRDKDDEIFNREEKIRDDEERLRIQKERLCIKKERLQSKEEALRIREEHLQRFAPMFTGSEEQRVHSYAGIEDTPSPSSQDSASHGSSSIMHPMNLNFPTTFSTGLIPPASLSFEFEESFLPTPLAEGHLRLPLVNTCTLAIEFDHSTYLLASIIHCTNRRNLG